MVFSMDNRAGAAALLVVVLLLGVLAGFISYQRAEAVIGGSGNVSQNTNPHNLSAGSSGMNAVSMEQICIFCHTPHSASTDSSLLNAPLWNHKLSTASYTVNSPGFSNRGGSAGIVNMLSTPGQPDGASKLCLSCHDGTVSIGAVLTEASNIAMNTHACLTADGKLISNATCKAGIGTDLRVKHVVSIAVNDSLITNSAAACPSQNTKVVYPWTTGFGTTVLLRPTAATYNGTYGVTYPSGAMPSGIYKSSYRYGVQCSSCHDPHYWVSTADPNTAGYKFIVTGFNNLCSACHANCP